MGRNNLFKRKVGMSKQLLESCRHASVPAMNWYLATRELSVGWQTLEEK